jgi:lipoprotein-anchoring transpeptidase ErfK/SrfK
MRPRWSDHSFDWNEALYAGKILAILFCFLALTQFGVSYTQTALPAQQQVAVRTPAPARVVAAQSIAPQADVPLISPRAIKSLTISDVLPQTGKFIAADLVAMQISLYQDGQLVAQYPIKTKGRAGTPWETPAGLYKVQSKEENHFSSIGKVNMPYSLQFYGNYFIHGWTTYPDGTPTPFTFSGGCIKLDTANAKHIYDFAEVGTPVFVYDTKEDTPPPSLTLAPATAPQVAADAWLVADIDTGDVFAEHNADAPESPASATTLMAALVANETISLDKKVQISEGALSDPPDQTSSTVKTFLVDDLFYPLLLQPNDLVTSALTSYNGTHLFVHTMNSTALALDMGSTTFAAASDTGENTTTAEDMYRLAWYLLNKKSFVLKIADTEKKTISAVDGSTYEIVHASSSPAISVVNFTVGTTTRHVAVITLNSADAIGDSQKLSQWIQQAATVETQAACALCAVPTYRKIEP